MHVSVAIFFIKLVYLLTQIVRPESGGVCIFMASAHPNPTSWVFKQSKLSFRLKIVVILSVAQLVRIVIFSQLEISHVLNGPTAKMTLDF